MLITSRLGRVLLPWHHPVIHRMLPSPQCPCEFLSAVRINENISHEGCHGLKSVKLDCRGSSSVTLQNSVLGFVRGMWLISWLEKAVDAAQALPTGLL
jgi:hypothetical protein